MLMNAPLLMVIASIFVLIQLGLMIVTVVKAMLKMALFALVILFTL